MTGGTLFVSRGVNVHAWIKERLLEMRFDDVTVTDAEKDGLNMKIREMKPRLVMMGCRFYQCCTPFMTAGLHKQFPKLNIAAVSITDFPDDLAMYFIVNGARSYVNFWEGPEQFYRGMEMIRNGREYVSPEVQRRFDMRDVSPKPLGNLTDRQVEVIRLIANGFTGVEIANVLYTSKNTIDNYKSDIYAALNVRNENEVIRVAIFLGIIKPEELNFYGGNYVLRPKPAKNQRPC